MSLISTLTQAFYKPQLNAVGIDKDGNYVDSQGKPTSLYTQPGAWQKAFNPYADQVAQENLAASSAPLTAMRQRAIGRSLGMADYNTLTPEQQALFPNEENALTTTSNNFTGGNIESTGSNLADINNGVPAIRGTANRNAYSAQALESQNATKKAAMAGILGTPSTEALGENQGAENVLSVGQGESALIPNELYNKGLGLRNTSSQLLGQQAALPYQNSELLNNSRIGAATSGQSVEDLPYSLTGQRASDIGALYSTLHPSIYASKFNATIDPTRGTIIPGRAVSPEMRSADALGMLPSGFGGGGSTMTLGSGRTISVPTQAIDPLNSSTQSVGQTHYTVDSGTGQLYRGGIPVDDNSKVTNEVSSAQAHKPLTIGQRLLQGITPTLGGQSHPSSRAAQLNATHAIQQHQANAQRVQELTGILTNPPTRVIGGRSPQRVSVYTQDQLQDMADELDKLSSQ